MGVVRGTEKCQFANFVPRNAVCQMKFFLPMSFWLYYHRSYWSDDDKKTKSKNKLHTTQWLHPLRWRYIIAEWTNNQLIDDGITHKHIDDDDKTQQFVKITSLKGSRISLSPPKFYWNKLVAIKSVKIPLKRPSIYGEFFCLVTRHIYIAQVCVACQPTTSTSSWSE